MTLRTHKYMVPLYKIQSPGRPGDRDSFTPVSAVHLFSFLPLQMQLINPTYVLQKTPDIISCERNHKHLFNSTRHESISEQV